MTIEERAHELIREDLAAHALGVLDAAAQSRLDEHLRMCAGCRALQREYEQVAELLPLGLPVARPSPAARLRLLDRARHAALPSASRRTQPWFDRTRVLAACVALLALILVGITAGVLLRDDTRSSDTTAVIERLQSRADVKVLSMTGSAAAPAAVGQLMIVPGEREAGLLVSSMPALPDGRDYQFWFVMPDKSRVSGAVFRVDSTGSAMVAVTAPTTFSDDWRCGVTEEPAGGSPAPTGPNVLIASYGSDYVSE